MKYALLSDSAKNRERVNNIVEKAMKQGDDVYTAQVNQAHQEAFQKIDCLSCGNCCSKHSPILLQTDLERIAKNTSLSMTELLTEYAEMDEEGDFVFKHQPCPFLGDDLHCSIYPYRPDACAEYPHSNRDRQLEISDLLKLNAFVCPAINHIINTLEKINLVI